MIGWNFHGPRPPYASLCERDRYVSLLSPTDYRPACVTLGVIAFTPPCVIGGIKSRRESEWLGPDYIETRREGGRTLQ